jgi:hypothetical protein
MDIAKDTPKSISLEITYTIAGAANTDPIPSLHTTTR